MAKSNMEKLEERRVREEAERQKAIENPSMWEPAYGFCAFNETDRVALAMALEALRRQVCAYGGGNRCDCKYGMMPDIYAIRQEFGLSRGEESFEPVPLGRDFYRGVVAGSEQTGCPELKELIHRLLHRDRTLF